MSSRILRPRAGAVITPLYGHFEVATPAPIKHAAINAFFPEDRPAEEAPPPPPAEPEPTEQEKYDVAFKAGFEAGDAAARQALEAQMKAAFSEVATMTAALRDARPKLRRDAEEDMVELSINIARRIIHRELSADPDAILSLTRLALEKVAMREVIKVRVNPAHAATLGKIPDLTIEPDPTLNRGDLLIETTRGSLDGSVERQLSEIERGFADRMRIGS